MRSGVKLTVAALVCGTAMALVGRPALADVSIAFGFNDGYWDVNHNWHAWRDHEEMDRWRREHAEHYYDWRHDRDADQGWHEKDHWWH